MITNRRHIAEFVQYHEDIFKTTFKELWIGQVFILAEEENDQEPGLKIKIGPSSYSNLQAYPTVIEVHRDENVILVQRYLS